MGRYLTRQMYLLSDSALAGLKTIKPTTLESAIQRAESLIDAYIGFEPRGGGFDPHYAFFQDNWDSKRLRVSLPNAPTPIRQILQYKIVITDQISAIVPLSDMGYQSFRNYIEITSPLFNTYGLTPILAQFGLQPALVQVDYAVGYYLPVLNERAIDMGDHKTYRTGRGFWATTYDLARQLQPFKAPPIPPVFTLNGTVDVSSVPIFDSVEGTITFPTPNRATDILTTSYTKTIPDAVTDAVIAQTTSILGERLLNQMGMQGLEEARNVDQMARRARPLRGEHDALCNDALNHLEEFVEAAIG